MNNNELKHFGVKGMKWGRRKANRTASNATKNLSDKQLRKEKKEIKREVEKRQRKAVIEGNNYAADKINGRWLDDFNSKWSKKIKSEDWTKDPLYGDYIKEYTDNFVKLNNEYLSNSETGKFVTKRGREVVAKMLDDTTITWV